MLIVQEKEIGQGVGNGYSWTITLHKQQEHQFWGNLLLRMTSKRVCTIASIFSNKVKSNIAFFCFFLSHSFNESWHTFQTHVKVFFLIKKKPRSNTLLPAKSRPPLWQHLHHKLHFIKKRSWKANTSFIQAVSIATLDCRLMWIEQQSDGPMMA